MANLKENFLQEMNSSDINDKKTKITLLLIGQGFTFQGRLFFFFLSKGPTLAKRGKEDTEEE